MIVENKNINTQKSKELKQPIIYSHSKINLILEDIYSYYLNYIVRVEPIQRSNALLIGSAVHHGLELQTSDLSDYFKENGSFEQKNTYSQEQILSESMVETYLENKEMILKEILKDCKVIEEYHELKLEVPLQKSPNKFLGIIDLLYLTDKGWIIVDYKTTSKTPNYDDYIDQLYRYCFLLERQFPEVKVYKIAIISLKKTSIKQRQKENIEEFKQRLLLEYKLHSDDYISYHVFDAGEDLHIFNREVLNNYYNNLEDLILLCDNLIDTKIFPINYSKANTIYGKNQFFDLIYFDKEKAKETLRIRDKIYNEELDEIEENRMMNEVDFQIIEAKNQDLFNKSIIHYDKFLEVIDNNIDNYDFDVITNNYIVDKSLLKKYYKTFIYLKNKEGLN